MALPSSGNLSMQQVLDEIRTTNPGRALPISLGDADVRALAGVPSGPISMSSLYGKSMAAPLTASGNNSYGYGNSDNAGIVSAYPSVNVSGGSGAKSYAWSVLSTNLPVDVLNATSPQCTVTKNFSKQSSGYVVTYLRCVISDGSGSVTVDNIVAELEWSTNA